MVSVFRNRGGFMGAAIVAGISGITAIGQPSRLANAALGKD